ncbi:HAMP domain-containing protein [Roseibium salinum]|uniref:HAMP domain-containing protein n=1 Tax=Roseibium salinum TaxID=1604349 RepID=A0ABT3R826_9HYPH|nr:HAMP domain-containing protein [Roseibium sp. DSM 29163]MCX2725260.1 HAMP domain-containing protein [Roseibium sp. DSM 29163]
MFSNEYKSAVRKAVKVCEAVADGDFEARIVNITEKGEAGRLLHAINRLIDRSDAYIRESRASLEYVASNKYFRRIAVRGMTGAFGEASRTVNTAMDTMEHRVAEFSRVVQLFEAQMKEVVDLGRLSGNGTGGLGNDAGELDLVGQGAGHIGCRCCRTRVRECRLGCSGNGADDEFGRRDQSSGERILTHHRRCGCRSRADDAGHQRSVGGIG